MQHGLRKSLQASLWSAVTLLVLQGCAGPDRSSGPATGAGKSDGPPLRPHGDLSQLPDAVPRAEPLSKWGNPDTYTVLGKTYRLLPTASGYDQVGNASWYGTKFHGKRTSSGEPFDMYRLTAAHRQLPIPAYVEVTNLENNKRTVVRVNDRGPFHSDRIIDLSYAAAVKLGFHNQGTARVRVRVLNPEAPPEPVVVASKPKLQGLNRQEPAPVTVAAAASAEQYFLQAGAYSQAGVAEGIRSRLAPLALAPTFVVQVPADRLFRVRMGPFASRAEAQQQQARLAAAEHPGSLILTADRVIRDGACLPQC